METDNLQSDRQFKTLILTDLCDSVTLVERIGDTAAADLFRRLDAQVLQLLQRWRGRLIDRSDGMFLLFDAPVDGLGFALDYMDELHALGKALKLPLQARMGLHVGYVLSWHNSEEAIAAGAKALEVEGLAKPMAARLMALARPGQILMSSAAESMMRSGQRELGDGGTNLRWKSHGRWRFKGLPTGQEVFEVGRQGRAPLRMPAGSAKARRELPLWRRPVALVAEIAVVAAVVAVTWVLVRSEPAIAFAERDWVVVADVRNLTGNPQLDHGLEQAFRISLEQSAYVNVLSDLKARETMKQMLLPENASIDRRAAMQIAVRDGARIVLEPSVREVHGQLRVSVDVVDPEKGQTVATVYADSHGVSSVLASTDVVVAQLRSRLGEAVADVRRASSPLPQVATSNLDALHVYAAALKAYGQGDVQRSLDYYDVAIGIDPEFAMAYLGQVRSLASLARFDDARQKLAIAEKLHDRLSTREALYMDAWKRELLGRNEAETYRAWKVLADLYPDHHGANANQALAALALGRYAEAERLAARLSVPQNGFRNAALQLQGRVQLAREKLPAALASLEEATAMADGRVNRYLIGAKAASGDMTGARNTLHQLPADNPGVWLEGVALALEEGRSADALDVIQRAARQCSGVQSGECEIFSVARLSAHAAAGVCISHQEVERVVRPLLERIAETDAPERGTRLYYAAAAVYAAQRLGLGAAFERDVQRLVELAESVGDPRATELVALVHANELRRSGDVTAALRRLKALVTEGELFQVHSVLAAVHRDMGNMQDAERENAWMRRHRGLAYAEYAGSSTLQALNVHDSVVGPGPLLCERMPPGRSVPEA